MIEVEKLVAFLELDMSKFRAGMSLAKKVTVSGMKGMGGAISGLGGGVRNLTSHVFSLKTALAGLGLGFVAKSFINVGSSVERMQIQLKVLLGSAKAANDMFSRLSDLASRLPFELQDIMGSATRLATAFGKDEEAILDMTKAAANVAAIFGEKVGGVAGAADQISRAFVSGTGAADRFREAGVNAMLGIEAGATVSGEEFRRKFLNVFGEVQGKFGSAALEMSTTWDGLMSMLADKWFQFRKNIMDAGVFDFLKSILIVLDKEFGNVLDNSSRMAEGWANTIISGLTEALKGVRYVMAAFRGLGGVWDTLKLAWQGFKLALISGADSIIGVMIKVKDAFGLNTEELKIHRKAMRAWATDTTKDIDKLKASIIEAFTQEGELEQRLPTLIKRVQVEYKKLRKAREEANKATAAPQEKELTEWNKGLNKALDDYKRKAGETKDAVAEGWTAGFNTMEDAVVNFVQTGKFNFKDFANSVIADLTRILARQALMKAFSAAFGADIGGMSGFASGGRVQPGQPIMVGERGPEMFIPDTSGRIQNKPGGAGNNVTVVNQYNISTGVQDTVRAEIMQMMPMIEKRTSQSVMSGISRGGRMTKTVRGAV